MERTAKIDEFVAEAVALMDARCDLTAAYLIGSLATDDISGPASDIDLLMVTDRHLSTSERHSAGGALADLAASAPLRGLEAVLYRAEVLAQPRHPLAYELNVNAGPGMSRSVSTSGDPAFWFLLDVAAARKHAVNVLGPPADEVIGEAPHAHVKAALVESLRWHREYGQPDADAVLTACRGLHWVATGTWLSKTAAGAAYLTANDSPVVERALKLRRAGIDGTVNAQEVARLQDQLEAALTT